MKRILRTAAAAEYVGLAPSTLEKMRLRGGGPTFIRIGGRAITSRRWSLTNGTRLEAAGDRWVPVRPST